MAAGARSTKDRRSLLLMTIVLVAFLSAAWMAANGQKSLDARSSYTLTVPRTALVPDLRVRLAAPTLNAAEAVQTEVHRVPVALRSTLRVSFSMLDIELRDTSERARAQVEAALRGRSSVARVERCPCTRESQAPAMAQVSDFVHWLQRSCSTSPRPVAVKGCITEYAAYPRKGPDVGDIYLYVIEARVTSGTQSVTKLVSHLTTTGSSQMVETSPRNGDYVLTTGHAQLPIRVFEYPIGTWSYEDNGAQFSQGRLEISGFPDVFDLGLVPTGASAQIKGATALVVKPPEKPSLKYSVIVEI